MGVDVSLVSKNTRRIYDGDRLYVLEDHNYDIDYNMPNLTQEYITKKDILIYLNLLLKTGINYYDIDYCKRWLNKWIKWIEQMDENDSFRFYKDNDNEWDDYMDTYQLDNEDDMHFIDRFYNEIVEGR